MCTDTSSLDADIIRLYGLRFKIELSFKQAVHQIGTFAYHSKVPIWCTACLKLSSILKRRP